MINNEENINISKTKDFIKTVSKITAVRPKLVLIMSQIDLTHLWHQQEPTFFPWISLTDQYKVYVTCPGCGTTRHGLWSKKLSDKTKGVGWFSKNLQHPICCDMLKGKKFRISYNNYGKVWNMINLSLIHI